MRNSFLVFGQPLIEQDEIDEVVDSMKKCWLGTGPKVARFEQDFAHYKGVKNVAAVNSCTAGLHLSLKVLDLKPGDEVITTAMTFCATVNVIIHAGATPVLADIDPNTLNISPEEIEKKITPRTKALLIVHFAGRPCNMDKIMKLVEKHGLILIEDCAHAIETEYKGQKSGTFGKYGVFSFYSTKNVVTGEGGMILAKDGDNLARIRMLTLHGMSLDAWKRFSDDGYKHYYIEEAGYKYNMMDLQAAIGIHQLKRVEKCWKRRQEIWNIYTDAFKNFPITVPSDPEPDTVHALHLYTIGINKDNCGISRDDFLVAMHKKNIGCGVHYLSIPEHPYYKRTFNWDPIQFPHALKCGRETVSIPLSPKLTDTDVQDVIDAVKDIVSK